MCRAMQCPGGEKGGKDTSASSRSEAHRYRELGPSDGSVQLPLKKALLKSGCERKCLAVPQDRIGDEGQLTHEGELTMYGPLPKQLVYTWSGIEGGPEGAGAVGRVDSWKVCRWLGGRQEWCVVAEERGTVHEATAQDILNRPSRGDDPGLRHKGCEQSIEPPMGGDAVVLHYDHEITARRIQGSLSERGDAAGFLAREDARRTGVLMQFPTELRADAVRDDGLDFTVS